MRKTVFALVKYKPNEIIDVFLNGKIVYESHEIHQIIENDGIAWDILKIVDYSKNNEYDDDFRDFNEAKDNLEKYKVILLNRYSYLRDKSERMRIKFKNLILSDNTAISLDKTIRETPKQKRKRIEGNRPNINSFNILREKSKVPRPIYFVNLVKYRGVAIYPPGYKGKQISGKKASYIYTRIAYKFNAKHGNLFVYLSDAIKTLADNTETKTTWEMIIIVKYKSFASIVDFNAEPMFQLAHIHKDAGIDHTYVYATISSNKNAELHDY